MNAYELHRMRASAFWYLKHEPHVRTYRADVCASCGGRLLAALATVSVGGQRYHDECFDSSSSATEGDWARP